MIGTLPTIDDEDTLLAFEGARDSLGESRIDRYCGNLAISADTYETTGPETGEGWARITLDDTDRVLLAILATGDRCIRYHWGGDYESTPATVEVEEWRNAHTVVVFWDNRGFHYPTFCSGQAEADRVWSAVEEESAKGWVDEDGEGEEG